MNETNPNQNPELSNNSEVYEQLTGLYEQVQGLVQVYRSNKISYYRPRGQQDKFHYATDLDTKLVLGGNRSGKTTSGTVEAIAHALGYRPWLANSDPNYIVRLADSSPIPVPNVGRVVAENFEVNIVQTIYPKFEEWLPAHLVRHVQRSQRGVPVRIELTNGSVIHFMSYEQDPRVFEGPAGHWFWCDEPPPQNIFNGLIRGLMDFNGVCWLTMTPLTEPWIAEVLFIKANIPGSGIRAWNYNVWDNCIDNGGTLSRKTILSTLDKFSAHERKTRETGEFLHLAGRVFPEWYASPPHWVDPFHIPRDWPRVCVIDPHPNKPIAVLWATVSPDDTWIVYRSIFNPELTTVEEVADEMRTLEGWQEDRTGRLRKTTNSEVVCLYIIDTSANEQERTSGLSIREEFANCGITCINANKRNKNAGINAIRKAIKKPTYQWGTVGLVVFNTCPEVKNNFQFFSWPRELTGRRNVVQDAKQEPVKKYDDFIDCIRYIYQMRLNYAMLIDVQHRADTFWHDDDDDDEIDTTPPWKSRVRSGYHAGFQRLDKRKR